MEFAKTLKILWKRRRLVALGACIAAIAAMLSICTVSLFPPGLHNRTNVFATASTQLLVDTPDSAFADLANEMTPLETRASVFARFLATPAAIELIAREAKLPLDSIEAQGPYDINLPVINQEPTADKRSTQIIGEGALYRLRFENNPVLPIVAIFAQAPTRDGAVALADAVPRALRAYVEQIQAHQHTPPERRVVIRKLGDATGGVVNAGADKQIAALVFLVVFGAWCMLLVPAQTLARGWRQAGQDAPPPNGNGNGAGHRGGDPSSGFGSPTEHERVR